MLNPFARNGAIGRLLIFIIASVGSRTKLVAGACQNRYISPIYVESVRFDMQALENPISIENPPSDKSS
jgi:hypothetical protein